MSILETGPRPGAPTLDRWQELVQARARAFAWPATPDIAARGLRPVAPAPRRRLAWVIAALLLVTLVLVAPPARAALLRWLQVGSVLIFPDAPAVAPTAQTGPTVTPRPSLLDKLDGETSPAQARNAAGFTLRAPPSLGSPDRTFVQSFDGPVVTFVWLKPELPAEPAIMLQQMGKGALLWKMAPAFIQETQVSGAPAIWTEGPYLLHLKNGDTNQDRIVEGRALIWEQHGITYRLESHLSLEDAVQLAESLQPLDLEATQ